MTNIANDLNPLVDDYWSKTFSNVPPIAHCFRNDFANRWIRFHSLPESKRYADSAAEYKLVLARHNTVLDDLIKSTHVIVVTTSYSLSQKPKAKKGNRFKRETPWRSLPLHELDDDYWSPTYLHLFIRERKWVTGALDRLLLQVADDQTRGVFIFSLTEGWLYHPYDGGADIILPSVVARDAIRNTHADWLSAYSSGL